MNLLKTAAMIAAIALLYAISGRLGLMLSIPPGYATAIFPAAGVALAAALLYGRAALPGVWLGSFLMNLLVGFDAGRALQWAALPVPGLIALGATLQAFAGAWLMRRFVGFPGPLDDERDILKFMALSGAVACLAGASVGISTLWYFGAVSTDKFVANWANWWLGDVIGVLIVVPVVLAFLAQPREQWRNRRFALTVPLSVAVSLVIAGYVAASHWEQQRIAAEFSYRAGKSGDELENVVWKQAESLAWIEHFYDSSQNVERDEFHRFVAPIIAASEDFKALEWVPRVTGTQRGAFEAQIRNEGYPEFQITERNASEQRVRAATRPEYFPVTYLEPWVGNETVLGYDVASDPVWRAALEQARTTGRPAATARLHLVQAGGAKSGWGVLVFLPLEQSASTGTSGHAQFAVLRGFILGVIGIDDLVGAVLHPSDRDLFTLELTDLSAPRADQALYASGLPGESLNAAFSYTRKFDFAGRQWQARYVATPAFVRQHSGWQSWMVLAAGLLFTSLLETFLLSVTGRTSRVERLIAERTHELHQAHRIVNEAQRIAHLGHWSWDLRTHQETWSAEQARIFGFEPSKLTIHHESFVAAIHADDRESVVNAIQAALAGKNSYRAECRIQQVSGAQRHVVCEGEVERDAAGTPVSMVGVVLDVTERKHAEAEIIAAKEEALRANHAKSEFLSSMSHELRTPLNAVLGFAQLMSFDRQITAGQQDAVGKIRAAGEHLLNLINDVLDLSRIEIGHVNLSMETVELDTLLGECRMLAQPLADARGLRLSAQPHCAGVHVVADRTRLKQAVVNLLSNAVKYNRVGGEVELGCELRDGNVRISVRDTGKGMSPEQQAQMFQPFNRLGQERGGIEGTGIGLVITKRLVELMNGELSLRSDVDQGSTFTIELLHVPAPQPAAQRVQTIAAPSPSSGTFALLCVEDNPASLELVQVLAASIWPKARFLGASSAEAGLDIAFGQSVDVILMDINLPGMDGYAALERLKADPRTAHVPVLALTANAMPGDVHRGKAAGFAAYLTKPLDMSLLISTVTTLLAQHPAAPSPVRRVLIAEDNPVNQEVLRAMVQALGYEADVVDNGADALDAVKNNPYALVFMDCEMPYMDGYDATRAIRQLAGLAARIPVVAVSAHAVEEDAEQRAQAGMTGVLPKPVNVEQLKRVLARYVP